MRIPYNSQLNESVYYFKLFTAWDFVVMMCLLGGTQILFSTFLSTVIALVGFVIYTIILRFSKPPGYNVHLFKSWIAPRRLKAGRAQIRSVVISSKP